MLYCSVDEAFEYCAVDPGDDVPPERANFTNLVEVANSEKPPALPVQPHKTMKESDMPSLDDFLEGSFVPDNVYAVPFPAVIVPDDYKDPKICGPNGEIKPRRPIPHVKASDVFGKIAEYKGEWVYSGKLNDWPSMSHVALQTVGKTEIKGKPLPKPSDIKEPTKATFLAPTWTTQGWLPNSPIFVWWYSEQHGAPRVLVGRQMLKALEMDEAKSRSAYATKIHHYAHRYPVIKEKETEHDRNNVHTLVLVEWSHGLYCTVCELAWLDAVGGFGGKSNWVEDKLAPGGPKLLKAMPDGMIKPWNGAQSEIRILDVPIKTVEEFEAYLSKYDEKSGLPFKEQRFLEWQRVNSAVVKIGRCKPENLAVYFMNYLARWPTYEVPYNNCQTFAADAFSFMSGTKETPYHPMLKKVYVQRILSFLYKTK